jgi:hypothetical protein
MRNFLIVGMLTTSQVRVDSSSSLEGIASGIDALLPFLLRPVCGHFFDALLHTRFNLV